MAAFSFVVIGIGLVASLRQDGWLLPAGLTGLLVAIFGIASISFPEAASTVDLMWGVAAIGWGIAFVVAAVTTQGAAEPAPYRTRETGAPAED